MFLRGLEPRHGQIYSWSLTTQQSLQIDVQKKKKILEVNLIKLSISYKEYKKIMIKILQRYKTLLQKLIINFNVLMVIVRARAQNNILGFGPYPTTLNCPRRNQ